MKWALPLLALTGILGTFPAAGDPPRPVADAWAADVQDVVFLSESRPVLIRLHLTIDGKPAIPAYQETLTRLFRFLDRDEDGFLNKLEVARMPSESMLGALFQGLSPQIIPSAPQFVDVDSDGDGKVDQTEFIRYYISNGYGPVRVLALPGQNVQSRSLTQLILGLLDTDKDGKISRSELQLAWRVLQRFDENDDELITVSELRAGVNTPLADATPTMPQPTSILDPRGRTRSLPAPILIVDREESSGKLGNRLKLAREVINRYDRNQNKLASREEIGLSRELFDQLKLKDGEVDGAGLIRWLLAFPDLEIAIASAGKTSLSRGIEDRHSPDRKVPFLPFKRLAPTALVTNLGSLRLNLVHREGVDGFSTAGLIAYYQDQFKVADTRKKGYLALKQVEEPQFRPLKLLFPLADRDGNGNLTEAEIQEYITVTAGFLEVVTSLVYSDHGQGLFELIDINKDGRLTQRELRNSVQLIPDHDLDHDDALARAEIPRQLQITITRGPTPNRTNNLNPGAATVVGMVSQNTTEGPLWFRKTDVNGDGDVSPREFIGTPDDFARIDQDGDGLISLAEAIAADKMFRDTAKTPK